MKVYLAKFVLNGKVAYKIGHTKWFHAIKRFSEESYTLFESVSIMDDILIQHDDPRQARLQSQIVEECLHGMFPKNFQLEPYFLTEDGTFDGLSGITEMFILKEGQTEQDVIQTFARVKKHVTRLLMKEKQIGR